MLPARRQRIGNALPIKRKQQIRFAVVVFVQNEEDTNAWRRLASTGQTVVARAGAGGSVTGGHDRKAFSGAPRPAGSERRPRRSRQQGRAFSQGTNAGCPWPAAQGLKTMLISEDYRQLAERCLKLAGECTDPVVAAALRALATDYLARAAGPAGLGRALSWE